MFLYVYGLADGLTDVADLVGIAQEPLLPVVAADIVAACGWTEGRPDPEREAVLRQDRLVRELHARAEAFLPTRFGTAMADVDALSAALRPLHARVREQFDLVRGREQMTLRILERESMPARPPEPDVQAAETGPGTRYLRARVAASTPAAIAPLIEALKSVQRGTRIETSRAPGLVATVYHLIDRQSSELYRRAAESAAAAMPSLIVRVSGPSPVYAFADLIRRVP